MIDKEITVEGFMAENAAQVDAMTLVVSERFKGKDGAPLPWTLKAINGAKDAQIRKMCMTGQKFDSLKYAALLTAVSVVVPDLKSAKLQDSYHVHGETELMEKMLTAAELNTLTIKAQEVNGFLKNYGDLIEQAKNL